MLSDRFDSLFSVDSSQLPLFLTLATVAEDKRWVIFDSGQGGVPPQE